MEDFILRFSEKLLKYKKGVFQQKTAREFVEKQIMKSTEDSKKELKKCLFPKNIVLSEANIKEAGLSRLLFSIKENVSDN